MGGSTKQKHDSFTLALTESVIFGGQWDPGYLFPLNFHFAASLGSNHVDSPIFCSVMKALVSWAHSVQSNGHLTNIQSLAEFQNYIPGLRSVCQ